MQCLSKIHTLYPTLWWICQSRLIVFLSWMTSFLPVSQRARVPIYERKKRPSHLGMMLSHSAASLSRRCKDAFVRHTRDRCINLTSAKRFHHSFPLERKTKRVKGTHGATMKGGGDSDEEEISDNDIFVSIFIGKFLNIILDTGNRMIVSSLIGRSNCLCSWIMDMITI